LFGTIDNGVMILNEFGRIVDQVWLELPDHHPYVSLDEHVIMPDHFHGIVIIRDTQNRLENGYSSDG